ncbi:MAG: hypothetical protein ACRDVE_22405, partial [Actinocrinis sp.]
LTVVDDGVGIPRDGRRSGLANMRERAEQLGGAFSVQPGQGGGTVLTWTAPTTIDADPSVDGGSAEGDAIADGPEAD